MVKQIFKDNFSKSDPKPKCQMLAMMFGDAELTAVRLASVGIANPDLLGIELNQLNMVC